MALQIIERRWCDGIKLGAPGEDWVVRHPPEAIEGSTRTYALDGGKPKNVDLCDPCDQELTLAELRVCLREFGQLAGSTKSKPGPKGNHADTVAKFVATGQRNGRTPKDGKRREQCLWCPLHYTGSGWGNHVQKEHGFEGLKDALGGQCPKCGEGGFETVSVHIQRTHAREFDSISEAFLWARDNGDPHGVYARRRAAGVGIIETPEGLL